MKAVAIKHTLFDSNHCSEHVQHSQLEPPVIGGYWTISTMSRTHILPQNVDNHQHHFIKCLKYFLQIMKNDIVLML